MLFETQADLTQQASGPAVNPSHTLETVIVSRSSRNFAVTPNARFSWLLANVNDDPRLPGSQIKSLIVQSIQEAMLARGLAIESSGKLPLADYYIAFTAALESSLDDATILKRHGIVPGYPSQAGSSKHEKGTLLIHVIDARTRQTVWQSAAQGAVDFSISEELRKRRIQVLVSQMIEGLPLH